MCSRCYKYCYTYLTLIKAYPFCVPGARAVHGLNIKTLLGRVDIEDQSLSRFFSLETVRLCMREVI